jgi:hydrogenase-4 component F
VALGGWGVFAALFHTFNHSLAKIAGFFAAGRLSQESGSTDLRSFGGSLRSSPWWGASLLASLLALIGVAPFAVFISEFMIVKTAVENGRWAVVILLLAGLLIAFISILQKAISAAWGTPPAGIPPAPPARWSEALVAILPLAVLLCLGLWMPEWMQQAITQAAGIMENRP